MNNCIKSNSAVTLAPFDSHSPGKFERNGNKLFFSASQSFYAITLNIMKIWCNCRNINLQKAYAWYCIGNIGMIAENVFLYVNRYRNRTSMLLRCNKRKCSSMKKSDDGCKIRNFCNPPCHYCWKRKTASQFQFVFLPNNVEKSFSLSKKRFFCHSFREQIMEIPREVFTWIARWKICASIK